MEECTFEPQIFTKKKKLENKQKSGVLKTQPGTTAMSMIPGEFAIGGIQD